MTKYYKLNASCNAWIPCEYVHGMKEIILYNNDLTECGVGLY